MVEKSKFLSPIFILLLITGFVLQSLPVSADEEDKDEDNLPSISEKTEGMKKMEGFLTLLSG